MRIRAVPIGVRAGIASPSSRRFSVAFQRPGISFAKEMPGLWKATLKRLEDGDAIPARTPIGTALILMLYYWPHLGPSDFTDNPELQIFSLKRRRPDARQDD